MTGLAIADEPTRAPSPIPSPGRAQAACRLLKLSARSIAALMPTEKQRKRLSPEVLANLEVRTLQGLVIALDVAMASVGRGINFFNSMVWDALASRWSPTYLEAVARGPGRWSRELDPKVGRAVDQELARAGVNWEALLRAARDGFGLYTMATDDKGSVIAMNNDLRHLFDEILSDDDAYGRYRRREMSRLRLALAADMAAEPKSFLPAGDDEWGGSWGTYKVASGFAYDISRPGPRKIRAMQIYESTICYLVAATFIADVDEMDAQHPKILRSDFPAGTSGLWAWRRARTAAGPAWRKTDGRLNSWRAIREQLETTPLDEWGHVGTRSRYVVTLGGRFQNLDFWLPDVPSKYRERWFRMATRSGDRQPPEGRDISSSVLWVLAVLLGDVKLEALLTAGSFWKRAARRLLERHPNRLVGFSGGDDPFLIESCKSAVMTRIYGSPLTEIAKRLAEDPEEFGVGLDVDTIKLLIADPDLHLETSINWYLPACRAAAQAAYKMSPRRGFSFIEPVDGELQIWNPLRTKPCRVAGNKRVEIYGEVPVRQVAVPIVNPNTGKRLVVHDLGAMAGRPGGMQKGDALEGIFLGLREVKVPGHKPQRLIVWKDLRIVSADGTEKKLSDLKLGGILGHKYPAMDLAAADYEVWDKKLEARVAPCTAHHMDTDFCVGVTEQLTERRVVSIIPVHDNWYVPADDEEHLAASIEDAGERFLRDLGPSIIASFELYLGKDERFGPGVLKMRERYEERVASGNWPKLRSAKK